MVCEHFLNVQMSKQRGKKWQLVRGPVLFSMKLALRKNILVHKNAQKLTYMHLGFHKFPGGDTQTPFRRGRRGEGLSLIHI